jgi:hypothetical protein
MELSHAIQVTGHDSHPDDKQEDEVELGLGWVSHRGFPL